MIVIMRKIIDKEKIYGFLTFKVQYDNGFYAISNTCESCFNGGSLDKYSFNDI